MAKDPAFLFYPGDWLGGTLGMTFEEKGAYMEMLMVQFNRGHMESRMGTQVVGQVWERIKHKFKIDSDGLYFNERLEIEINKRKKFVSSRLNNINGKNTTSHMDNHMESHMDDHTTSRMEDINRNRNRVKDTTKKGAKKKFVKPTLEDFTAYFIENEFGADLAKRVFTLYDDLNWHDTQGNPILSWKGKCQTVWFKPENKPKQGLGERSAEDMEKIYDLYREPGSTSRFVP